MGNETLALTGAWQHDGVLPHLPGAAAHTVHQTGDQAAVEPEGDGPGDHRPVSGARVGTQLQGGREKSFISNKLGHCKHLNNT